MKKEIIEISRLIAEFMGYRYQESNFFGVMEFYKSMNDKFPEGDLNYNSWELIMPVADKIRDLNCFVSIRFNRQLNTTTTTIASFDPKWKKDIVEHGVGPESILNACAGFIEWYNENK